MKSITPFLWFDDDLQEAFEFYTSVFPDGKVHSLMRLPDGKVITGDIEIAGQRVQGVNGGPEFTQTEAFSFLVEVEGQDEVDHYWDTLTADGGQESQCGWLKDRFGVSWQIVPTEFFEMMNDPDGEKTQRVMAAMMQMQKFDVAKLREAYES